MYRQTLRGVAVAGEPRGDKKFYVTFVDKKRTLTAHNMFVTAVIHLDELKLEPILTLKSESNCERKRKNLKKRGRAEMKSARQQQFPKTASNQKKKKKNTGLCQTPSSPISAVGLPLVERLCISLACQGAEAITHSCISFHHSSLLHTP